MNKEERVKLIFETLSKLAGFEIKPDKEFYVTTDGVKTIYKVGENLNLYYRTPNGAYIMSAFNILVFFNSGYQLEEIKEPLTTEKEREFLRHFNFEKLKISTHSYTYLNMYDKNDLIVTIVNLENINLSFSGLKEVKRYSRKELGL